MAIRATEETSSARQRIGGDDLHEMIAAATRLFEHNVETIDALNVYPVPDGDTGTNMVLTLRDAMKGLEAVRGAGLGVVAGKLAEAAELGARGNSGLILSQFFKGMALELGGTSDCGVAEFAMSLQRAREQAYRAVGRPVEGTMLTVISRVAQAAQRCAEAGSTVPQMFDAICEAAREAVALTPTLLPVLREAGVVDAGGQGLSVILEGARRYVAGEESGDMEVPVPAPIGVAEHAGTVTSRFLEAADQEAYGYCTQFVVQGQDLDADAIREQMATVAQSTVVVGGGDAVNIHVHAFDPGPVVSFGASLGTLSQVKIQSMDEQRRQYSAARRQEVAPAPDGAEAAQVAVVAVAWGDGLERVFTELGAAGIVRAGDTMNPSVQEILSTVEGAPSNAVIVLPNNRNIVQTARQAVELSRKRVKVVPTTTIPQGVAAMLALNPERDLDANAADMEGAMASIRTGGVCTAVRAAEVDGVSVERGQIIGLLEREVAAAGDSPNEVLLSLLRAADVAEGDLVTLYWGSELTEGDADEAGRAVKAAFPGAEVEVVRGGQPHYHYILSIE
jgi:DAK2 domain fusion protein YloV